MFQKFGNTLSCKVVFSEEGKSKGYGFVQFESEESANAAIEKLNGTMVGDKQMYVHFHICCNHLAFHFAIMMNLDELIVLLFIRFLSKSMYL